jgi:hypothetical protein
MFISSKQNRVRFFGNQDPREKKEPDRILDARLWRTTTAASALAPALSSLPSCILSQGATSSREVLSPIAEPPLFRAMITAPLCATCKLLRRTACFKLKLLLGSGS